MACLARLATFFESRLILIHVGERSEEKYQVIANHLETFIDRNLDFEIIFEPGDPVNVILEAIEKKNIDLIILGALQRERFLQFYIGSIARKISFPIYLHLFYIFKFNKEHIFELLLNISQFPQMPVKNSNLHNCEGGSRALLWRRAGAHARLWSPR